MAVLVATMIWLGAAPAVAGTPRRGAELDRGASEQGPPLRRGKRTVPDFDGRPSPPPTAKDVALWVPRAALFLPWVVYEYAVRRPVGWAVVAGERAKGVRKMFRFLFLGKGTGPAYFPIAYYDFGFQPSVGARILWHSGFLGPGSGLSLKLATWGPSWLRADFQEKIPVGDASRVIVDAEFWRRPDRVHFGIGPRSSEDGGRYRSDIVNARLTFDRRVARQIHVAPFVLLRWHEFDADGCCGATLADLVASGEIASLPAGFDGYNAGVTGVKVSFDPRAGGRGTGSAVLAKLNVEHAVDPSHPDTRWWHYGGSLGGVVHLDDVDEKVIDAAVIVDFADPVGESEIPFTELAGLGGSKNLRGFPSGRLVDRSAIAAMVRYRWPLAAWLDGTLYAGTGNVFGEHLDGLDVSLLRGSFGLGVSLTGLWETRAVQLWSAIGTETWEDGFSPSSFRLVLGWAHEP